ncbi:MAG TPA: LeuA family protein [Thermoanaerobaculia bacterium]|jgi:2-isopropylmalate synthase|nr:LeuA family protein [Thermoanaerobaculia bacterium]
MALSEADLIHDWNHAGGGEMKPLRGRVELNDETLRDGLQSPSVRTPSIDKKIGILHEMVALGIDALDLGLPGAGPHVVKDVLALAREIADHKLPIAPNCAARTMEADVRPIVEISQQVGIPIEAATFIGSSPIRQYAEGWTLDRMLALSEQAVSFAVKQGLPVMFVTEDTTRAHPDDLRRLYTVAVEAGARRVCVADTVGHATPNGARALTRFIREVVDATGEQVQVDWHGHRDRGLGEINALAAAEAGADRLHGTALGVGERVGNTPMDLLLVNLHLLGWRQYDLSRLPEYCRLVSEATGVPFPDNWPVVGIDAFRTGTGVHAAAILKARAKGDDWLADRIYSGVPASLVGRRQLVEIGPMSGESNVVCWLQARGVEPRQELVTAIFQRAKAASAVLGEEELLALCAELGVTVPAAHG